MAKSTRLRINYVVADNTDYSRPKLEQEFEYTTTGDEYQPISLEVTNGAAAALRTVYLARFDAISYIVLNNTGSVDVTVTWTDNDANANTQRIAASGAPLVICDVDPSAADLVLAADSSSAIVEGIVFAN